VENSSNKAIHSPFGNHSLPLLNDDGANRRNQPPTAPHNPVPVNQQHVPSAKENQDIEGGSSTIPSQGQPQAGEPAKNLLSSFTAANTNTTTVN
jgi:histone deacetylase complex regulatory component SIN3